MRSVNRRSVSLALALALLGACGTTTTAGRPSAAAPPPAAGAADRSAARRLFAANQLEAAVAAYEQLLAGPEDAGLDVEAATAMSRLAGKQASADAAQALRRRAYALLARARALGLDEPYIELFFREVAEDGTLISRPTPRYSALPEVQQAIVEGEAAFARNDYDGAVRAYGRAVALEPGNYFATLWTGDCHFARQDWDQAALWFRKAIAIDRDAETAHRYLGDVLERQQRYPEALAEYVEAVVASPYDRFPRNALQKRMEARSRPLVPQLPRGRLELGGAPIEVSPGPGGRRGLAEEVAALRAAAGLQGVDARWRPHVEALARLRDAGLLEAYVLLDRGSADVAPDYEPYRAAHREELRRYLRAYWCGL
jgi:tetratricopeptide (TPR) repeat protein